MLDARQRAPAEEIGASSLPISCIICQEGLETTNRNEFYRISSCGNAGMLLPVLSAQHCNLRLNSHEFLWTSPDIYMSIPKTQAGLLVM